MDMCALDKAKAILARAKGKDKAITIGQLADYLVISRRETEQLIEAHLQQFPFVLVSGSSGLYQPMTAEELNQYLHSLHSRHRKMQQREATVRRKAKAAGWLQEATGRFIGRPKQQELFT